MAQTSTPSSTNTPEVWGYHKLPVEVKQIIFDLVFPRELRIKLHHVQSEQRPDGTTKPYAIQVQNKEDWRTMLRLQRIPEINNDFIQPALAKKQIVITLELNRCEMLGKVWKTPFVDNIPKLQQCITDWDAFLAKFPFRRLTTVLPYDLWGDRFSELHYLQLTLEQVTAAEPSTDGNPKPWTKKAAVWKRAHETGLDVQTALKLRSAIEADLADFVKLRSQGGLSEDTIGGLCDRMVKIGKTVGDRKTFKYSVNNFEMGLLLASLDLPGITKMNDMDWEEV